METLKIKKIEKIDNYDDEFVYSVNIKDNHNYFLENGVLSQNCLLILDEAQNCDIRQLMLFVTRMGEESKVIISGDISQYDIHKDMLALNQFAAMVKGINGVCAFEFLKEDIMRHPMLIEITDRYEKLQFQNKLPINKKM